MDALTSTDFSRLVRNTNWLVGKTPQGYQPYQTVGYKVRLGKGFPNNYYPYGCGRDSLHHGRDIGSPRGYALMAPIYAWGRCIVRINRYEVNARGQGAGYHRYIQVYFPDVNWSMTLGHLRNGTARPVGTVLRRGQRLANIGTRNEGILNSHVHLRTAPGDWRKPIPPCWDHDPLRLWRKLGLPG